MSNPDAGMIFEQPVSNLTGTGERHHEKAQQNDADHIEDGKEPKDVFEHVEDMHFDPKMVRRTLIKLDLMIMPVVTCLYLCSSLDKSNLGNAKSLGMVKDLGSDPTGSTYAFLNALYYIGYAPLMVPITLLAKRTRLSWMVGGTGVYWGVAASCFAAVKTFPQAYACRYMVGLGEAGFTPIIPVYLNRWYTRGDLATRVGFWLCAAPLGGFLNGIIAYGVSFIHSHIESWRVLFLIEGLCTVVIGLTALLVLPEDIGSARWFSDEEKTYLLWRRRHEASTEVNRINWKQALGALYRWQTLLPALMNMALQISGASLSAFLPTFLTEAGFKGANAQIATLAPYGSAIVFMMSCSYFSDKYQNRGYFMLGGMIMQTLGFVLYLGSKSNNKAQHIAALILAESGHYICTPLVLVWLANNCGSESRRVVAISLIVTFAQALAISSGYLFPTPDGPRYIMGTSVCIGMSGLGVLAILAYMFLLKRANKQRDAVEGRPPADVQPDTVTYADMAPGFRYSL